MATDIAARADRVKGALYGMLIADALAMPTHWYYSGARGIMRDYGGPITGYVKPVLHQADSIMGKSNTGGAGRGDDRGTIIGDTICHGKRQYWKSGSTYHYHCTLDAGDSTLEARLARRVIDVLGQRQGVALGALQQDYITFMTTPGSHNDCYASTAHRMFFKNLVAGKAPSACPDNDQHNVDTTDAITCAIPVSLWADDDATAADDCAKVVALTRDSQVACQLSRFFAGMLRSVVRGTGMKEACLTAGKSMRYDVQTDVFTSRGDPLTA